MEKIYGIIYMLTNKINGKIYIGQTIQKLNKRWRGHVCKSKNPKENSTPVLCAIRKYGEDAFSRKVMCYAWNKNQLNKLEENYTLLLQSNQSKVGYNIAVGACVKGEPRERSTRKQTGELSCKFRKDVDTEELVTLYKSGILISEMQKRFKTSRCLIECRLKKEGVVLVDPREKIIEDKDIICSEYLSGSSLKEIAEKRSLHYQIIRRVLTKEGITIRKIRINQKELSEKYLNGLSVKRLAKEYGVDQSSVSSRLRKAGIQLRNPKEAREILKDYHPPYPP